MGQTALDVTYQRQGQLHQTLRNAPLVHDAAREDEERDVDAEWRSEDHDAAADGDDGGEHADDEAVAGQQQGGIAQPPSP